MEKEKEKVQVAFSLCSDLMDCLAALAYTVTRDIEKSEYYARETFCTLMSEWEEVNDFEFDVVEEVNE